MRSDLRLLSGALLSAAIVASMGCDDDLNDSNDEDTGVGEDAGSGSDAGLDFDGSIDYSGFTPINPSYDRDGDSFFSTPWPSNARRTRSGAPDMDGFPNPANAVLMDEFLRSIEEGTDGFSPNPVAYFVYDAELPQTSIPHPADTMTAAGAVQLIRLDGDACGERTPVESSFVTEPDNYTEDNTLRVAPVIGFNLEPHATYAFVVLRTLGNEDGLTSAPADTFVSALRGESEIGLLNDTYAPLRDCLPETGIQAGDISIATVFTTSDPVAETRRIRDFVMDSTNVPSPEIVDFARSENLSNSSREVWFGTYRTPIFQEGTTPYSGIGSGGAFAFDESGTPQIVRYEDVPFSVSWPTTIDGPYPVVVWSDGTGANERSHIGDNPFDEALARGFAVANFQPQFHAGRSGPTANEELSSFNFLNPDAGRTNFRQQVIDTSYFVRLLAESQSQMPDLPVLDIENMVYGGHSQGSLVGALVAGVESRFKSYYFNGVGALLSITIVEREDFLDFSATIENVLDVDGHIDRVHPVTQVFQMGADVTDPANYARYWRGWEGHESGNNVLMSNGQQDDTTHFTSMDFIMIASDAAPISPAGWDWDPYLVDDRLEEGLPIQGNRSALDGSPITLAHYTDPDQGHFTVYRDSSVARMAADFWLTSLDDVPEVDK